jgi:hypothetical protein
MYRILSSLELISGPPESGPVSVETREASALQGVARFMGVAIGARRQRCGRLRTR